MSKTYPPYAPEYRRQMVELVGAGRSAGELAREWRCCCLPKVDSSGAVLRRSAIGYVRAIETKGVVRTV